MDEGAAGGNGASEPTEPARSKHDGGSVVRISTALGTFTVEIVNEMGPIADALTADVERATIACLRAHRHLARETAVAEVLRGELEYRGIEL
jgi:hypothetical protein